MRMPASLQLFAFGLLALILVSITSAFAAGLRIHLRMLDSSLFPLQLKISNLPPVRGYI